MKLAPLLLALTLAASASAQTFTDPANLRGERVSPSDGHELPIDTSEAEGGHGLQQLLRKLNTRASLLLITAHPDDEDGGMLTLYSRGLGARVATLTLNRGEGGQNFMTADFEDALGLIRTQELLSADRYFDASQFFGTEVDFGFSKTKEESFQKWGHERVLYDTVRAIRLCRPLVIAVVFIGGVTDGHGQHQVSGEIAQEAFKDAADPSIFPDQLAEGILPWQALKVYARVPMQSITAKGLFDYATNQYTPARFTNYVTGQVTTTKPSADVVVHEGATDPLLTDPATGQPRSYVQFARIGLGLQRTQISKSMRLPPPGPFDVSYHLYGSALCNAPADAKFLTPSPKSVILSEAGSPGRNAVILSEARSAQSKDPCILPAAALPPEVPNREQAPTARPITAQGNALGGQATRSIRAESPIYNANLTTQPSFFTGIDTSLEGIADLAPDTDAAPINLRGNLRVIAAAIAAAQNLFTPDHPGLTAAPLADALNLTDKIIKGVEFSTLPPDQKQSVLHELRIKRVQLNDALALALGLHLDATAPTADLVASAPTELHTTLTEASTAPLNIDHLWIDGAASSQRQYLYTSAPPQLSVAKPLDSTWQIPADHLTEITQPYFYRDNIEQAVYKLRDPALRNAPQTPSPLTAWATVDYQGAETTLGSIVHSGPQPVSIVPPVSIASSPRATVLPNGQPTAELTATLRTAGTISANINVQSPDHWTIQAKAVPAPSTATAHSIDFYLHPTAAFTQTQLFQVTAQTPDHHTYTEGYRPVGYPGLIYTNDYTPATTRVVPVDLKLPALKLPEHLRIAYLPGTGDTVPEALASIGLTPTLLTVADLTASKLANFDTVILGVRTYAAHPELHGAPTQALLDFARNGGNVLVQYQISDFTSADAPYPLSLGNTEKVVDETDPVQLLAPSNPLLTTPNPITTADFDNWIEERGHGFLDTWDPHYTALTETHDPGTAAGSPETVSPQLPQRGGLITTPLGPDPKHQGRWTYCAFALYRQLPEAVPGAFRLFVNLLTPHRLNRLIPGQTLLNPACASQNRAVYVDLQHETGLSMQ
jgi:LmbE family N-acetylglucosaminyl deacetylase